MLRPENADPEPTVKQREIQEQISRMRASFELFQKTQGT
jgi:hypothetical protein